MMHNLYHRNILSERRTRSLDYSAQVPGKNRRFELPSARSESCGTSWILFAVCFRVYPELNAAMPWDVLPPISGSQLRNFQIGHAMVKCFAWVYFINHTRTC